MTTPESRQALARTQPEQTFPQLTEEQLARVSARGRVRRVDRGEILIAAAKPTHVFFVALSATIEVVRGDDSREIVRIISHGEFTGEMSILSGRPMINTLRVGEPGDL